MKNQNGFTLVELSIVLVIIGLLIGGILVAQTMIDSASVQKFTRQIQQYDVALEQFEERYNCIPGDCSNFYSSGDDDGVVEDGSNQDNSFTGEVAYFWENLSEGISLDETYTNSVSSGIDFGVNVPEAAIGDDGGVLFINVVDVEAGGGHLGENVYAILTLEGANAANLNQQTSVAEPVSVQDSIAFDKKIDDGVPNSGNVITFGNTNDPGAQVGDAPRAACSTGANWNLATTEDSPCALSIIAGKTY